MKKVILSIAVYIFIAFLISFILGVCLLPVADVAASSVVPYKIQNGLKTIFNFCPSICLTAFLLGCSVGFDESNAGSHKRFSSSVVKLFQKVMIIAIILTFIITMCRLVFLPLSNFRQSRLETTPQLLEEYLELSQHHIDTASPTLAAQYAKRALALDPQNETARKLSRKAELFTKEIEAEKARQRQQEIADLNEARKTNRDYSVIESQLSVYELLQKSYDAYDKKDWFLSHYYATQALRLSDTKDPNYDMARFQATEAWNRLSISQEEGDTEGYAFFRTKMAGYSALLAGDYLKAYYIFHGLYSEDILKSRDPDVIRYLALSHDNLLNTYFFIDETYDLSRFESATNVYFSVQHKDSSYDIITIRGVTEVEGTGGLVRYLRNVRIVQFDKNGTFVKSIETPYAKMLAVETETISDYEKEILQIPEDCKIIPYLLLCSVDRDREDIRNIPVYSFKENYSEEELNQIFWTIPYEDFSLICQAQNGTENMNPFSLNKMAKKASLYGFSQEVFAENALNKIFYPALILITLIFIASIAWNYRLKQGTIFKFVWIFLLPLFNGLFHLLVLFADFVINLFDCIFIDTVGVNLAMYIGSAIYLIALLTVSIVFLARKGD